MKDLSESNPFRGGEGGTAAGAVLSVDMGRNLYHILVLWDQRQWASECSPTEIGRSLCHNKESAVLFLEDGSYSVVQENARFTEITSIEWGSELLIGETI
jgi:hypothetical protein